MRIVPVVCLALATAVVGLMLPAASSHAENYPTPAQNCVSTGVSTEGVGNCKNNKEDHNPGFSSDRSASADLAGHVNAVTQRR